MEEEAVGLLQLVEIRDHLFRVAVQILLVAGRAVRLQLQHGQHVHVVDPVARLVGEAVGRGIVPLLIGEGLAEGKELRIFGLDGDLERHDAKDLVVDVMAPGDARLLGAAGHQRLELLNQLLPQRVVVG